MRLHLEFDYVTFDGQPIGGATIIGSPDFEDTTTTTRKSLVLIIVTAHKEKAGRCLPAFRLHHGQGGFEPTVRYRRTQHFPGVRLKPLGHLSRHHFHTNKQKGRGFLSPR